jgi:RimJ/RimL family protein N-acetyltransferase
MPTIQTPRLELIAATPDVARGEAEGAADWYAPLRVAPPEAWPPPYNDTASQAWFARRVEHDAASPGWLLWYVVRRPDAVFPRRLLIGNCGFRGAPDERGSVELGYSLVPSWQRRGYGTELTAALVAWAFGHPRLERVIAITYPELTASIRVLEKNGFQPTGRGADRSLVFELRRTVYEGRLTKAGAALHDVGRY